MEPVASTSNPPEPDNHRHHGFDPSSPEFTERVIRAVRHRLRLLHRSESLFFVLGVTGNVYTVTLSATPSCTCPDRATPCKHILFVFIRVLGVALDDSCLWRRSLRQCQIQRLLSLPISGDALAGAAVRDRFHQLFYDFRGGGSARSDVMGDGCTACPVCLEVMGKEEKVVECVTCKNSLHVECFLTWRKNFRRRSATCVLCRARWRNGGTDEQEKYLNLAAFVGEEDRMNWDQQCGE